MNENIQILLEKVSGDEALLAKFSACKTVDEAYELASSLVSGYTKEEFVEVMNALSAAEDADISDEDLAAAAGGDAGEAMKLSLFGSAVKTSVEISKTVVKSAKVISEEVPKSVVKSAREVSKFSEEVSKSVAKSVSKVSKALAV